MRPRLIEGRWGLMLKGVLLWTLTHLCPAGFATPHEVLAEANNSPPTVSLTQPTNGTVFPGPGPIRLSATASDSDGSIARVEFYAGNHLLGTATNSPYTWDWTVGRSGLHTLYAVATDNLGASNRSTGRTILIGSGVTSNLTFVPAGSVWKYLDDGSNQGTVWRRADFDDSGWKTGTAEFGYGDGDEATVVDFGGNEANRFITTYFRTRFVVPDAAAVPTLIVRLLRDDGAIVWLNGAQVFRSNMPTGMVGHTALATLNLGPPAEQTFVTQTSSPSLLVNGTNVLAVEVHQSSPSSGDLSFDLELLGSDLPRVTRGPWLQTGTPTSVIVKWRTDRPADSTVRYGTAPDDLQLRADRSALTNQHEVRLDDLAPATTYFYAIGTSGGSIAGGPDYFFTTPPVPGTPQRTRIWAIGDSGTANVNAQNVRDAYYRFAGTNATHLWLMLGDNAYNSGTDTEYQGAVFNTYPTLLRQSVLWSTIGNHDTAQSQNPAPTIAYYNIFTLPRNAEAGGVASGTEDYYSWDYANIHFVCLDAMTSANSPGSAMLTWLENDLTTTTQQWLIAFWHHPPYTKGSHDSDEETRLTEMRENVLPVLEAHGVDLVLCGHSHSYERSFLLNGHYGASATLTASMIKDGGSGRAYETGAYRKPDAGPAPNQGAVYVVAGSSGQISGGTLDHPAMFISLNRLGSVVLDIVDRRLDLRFLRETGDVEDHFTILKGPDPAPRLTIARSAEAVLISWPVGVTNFTLEAASEPDAASWDLAIPPPGVVGSSYVVTNAPEGARRFYRLRRP